MQCTKCLAKTAEPDGIYTAGAAAKAAAKALSGQGLRVSKNKSINFEDIVFIILCKGKIALKFNHNKKVLGVGNTVDIADISGIAVSAKGVSQIIQETKLQREHLYVSCSKRIPDYKNVYMGNECSWHCNEGCTKNRT